MVLQPSCRAYNVKLCRGRFHKMQVGGRTVPKGTTRCGRPPASLDRPSAPTAVSSFLAQRDEVDCGEADVLCDLPDEPRRDVTPAMIWDGRATTVSMTKLFVRAALAHLDEAEGFQYRNDLTRAKRRNATHERYATSSVCVPTNSASRVGSPSSRSMSTTSRRFA